MKNIIFSPKMRWKGEFCGVYMGQYFGPYFPSSIAYLFDILDTLLAKSLGLNLVLKLRNFSTLSIWFPAAGFANDDLLIK
jgi:hypothetical protein